MKAKHGGIEARGAKTWNSEATKNTKNDRRAVENEVGREAKRERPRADLQERAGGDDAIVNESI